MFNEYLTNWAKFVSKTYLDFAPKYMAVSVDGQTYYTEYTEEALKKDGYLPVTDTGKPETEKQYNTCYRLSSDGTKIEIYYEEYIPSRKELLLIEKYELESWLSAHDYIGTKIATGRSTISDYTEEIAMMRTKSARLEEVRKELEEL